MLSVILAAALTAPSPPPIAAAQAQAEARAAETAYNRCMHVQADGDDNGTGPSITSDAAMGICRPALESYLTAQERWIEVANISEAERHEARRIVRNSLRVLRDASLFPNRAPRNYGQ